VRSPKRLTVLLEKRLKNRIDVPENLLSVFVLSVGRNVILRFVLPLKTNTLDISICWAFCITFGRIRPKIRAAGEDACRS
jgi:hypothetical protein